MPNRRQHAAFGLGVGMAYAGYKARYGNNLHILLEGAGGAAGGWLGGPCPDSLEPATNPNHRGPAHGILPVVTVGGLALNRLDSAQKWLRDQAERCRCARLGAQSPAAAAWYGLWEWVCYILAGALAGFVAGYASHVVLDFRTPRCLPIIS